MFIVSDKHFLCTISSYVIIIGQIGDWKNHFSAKLSDLYDLWIEKWTEGTSLKFPTISTIKIWFKVFICV